MVGLCIFLEILKTIMRDKIGAIRLVPKEGKLKFYGGSAIIY
jgi:hypothetical protein